MSFVERARRVLFVVLAMACLWPAVTAPAALAGGVVFALVIGNPFAVHVARGSGLLLKTCMVGLGFGLPLATVISAGATGLWVTGLGAAGILLGGLFLARLFSLDRHCGGLISAGTAICGGSAIAAVAPVTGARPESISMSLACVFVLNAVALYAFPWVGGALELSQSEFATWAAIAIHDTSSVVGAATTYGDQALAEATILKLARALWIVPLVLVFMFLNRHSAAAADGKRPRIEWPVFILLFVIAAGLRTLLPALEDQFDAIARMARQGLVLALFLIGSGLGVALFRSLGWRPLAHAALLWLLVSSATLGLVMSGLLPTT